MPWAIQAASDGVNYDIYRQDKDNSCACACLSMCAKLIKNKILDEATIRQWVADAEGGARKSKEGVREFDTTGTFNDVISSVFTKIGVTSFPVKGQHNVAKWIKRVNAAHPAIFQAYWLQYNGTTLAWEFTGGGHSVVAVKVHGTNLIMLDPAVGVVEMPVADAPRYTVTYPPAVAPSYAYMEEMRTTF